MQKGGNVRISTNLNNDELTNLKKAKELLLAIKQKHSLSQQQVFGLLQEELYLPSSILNKKLTVLESVVKYLKENESLTLSSIGELLNRDQRNIWHALDNSKKKHPAKLSIKSESLLIPINIFSHPKFSALESVVVHMKEKLGLNYHEIALIIKRDDRTIWTVYNNIRKKRIHGKE